MKKPLADAKAESNSAVSAPGRSPWALLRPLDAAHDEPSQVQCCTWRRPPGRIADSGFQMKKPLAFARGFHLGSGNDLLSRAVSSQVPSALKGLTSVFGMGTGGTLSP